MADADVFRACRPALIQPPPVGDSMHPMRKLLWLGFGVVLAYFAVTVKLGAHTLWGHAVRIAKTKEAKDLAHGVKQTTEQAVHKAKEELETAQPDTSPAAASAR